MFVRGTLASTLTVATCTLALTACSALGAVARNDTSQPDSMPSVAGPEVVSATTNVDGTNRVDAGKSIQITSNNPWVVEKVSTAGSSGATNEEALSLAVWKSAPVLPGQVTTVIATMRNLQTGQTQTVQRSVLGGPALHTYSATISPEKGKYGVGVVPIVEFSRPVPEANRADVTAHLSVTSTPTPVPGGWRWISDTQAAFRPANGFWLANQSVTVKADIKTARITGTKSEGGDTWGLRNEAVTFAIPRAMVLTLDGKTDRGVATVDGKVIRKFVTSLGKPGYETRNGVKTIMERYEITRMTNVGVTTNEVYDLQVPYAMRLTNSGEFLHGAPWNGQIGYANTSHGCSHLTMTDAAYFFKKTITYDPVITKNAGPKDDYYNGPGSLWNIPAAKWARMKVKGFSS